MRTQDHEETPPHYVSDLAYRSRLALAVTDEASLDAFVQAYINQALESKIVG